MTDAMAILAQHGRTFHLASRLLPAAARQDAAVLYAFCRHVDDLADEAVSVAAGRADLAAVRDELTAGAGRPWIEAFLEVARRRDLDLAVALHLVDAVASDLDEVRMADDVALRRYCYGVAGTVGIMMCAVLGITDPTALPRAVDLGIAMQLTNVCRDVAEDARMGRIYLPADRLVAAGVPPEDLLAGTAPPDAVAGVVRDLLEVAEVYYRSADAGLRAIPWPARGAIRVASRVYRAIGVRLVRRHGGNPLHGRTVVPVPQRIGIAVLALPGLAYPGMWIGPIPPPDRGLHRGLAGLPGVAA